MDETQRTAIAVLRGTVSVIYGAQNNELSALFSQQIGLPRKCTFTLSKLWLFGLRKPKLYLVIHFLKLLGLTKLLLVSPTLSLMNTTKEL